MVDTLTFVETLQILTCGECRIRHAIPMSLYEDRRKNGGNWYCPNGHHLHFIELENDKLKKALAGARARAEGLETSLSMAREDRDRERRRRIATSGVVTRMKTRAAHGVCPCCKRSFANVARHMKTKHADFVAEASHGE